MTKATRGAVLPAAVVVLSAVIAAVTTAAPLQAAPSEVPIAITGFSFQPSTVSGRPGTRFVWTNQDGGEHTASDGGPFRLFDTGVLDDGEQGAVTIASAGTYPYLCDLHEGMVGTLAVRPGARPRVATVGSPLRIRVSAGAGADGFRHEVQVRVDDGPWTIVQEPGPGPIVEVAAASAGTYRFRARAVRTSDGVAGNWSPASRRVMVT